MKCRATAELAEKVREHDEAISKMSEYESNMNLLEIFFGKEATAQVPGRENNKPQTSWQNVQRWRQRSLWRITTPCKWKS